MSNKGEWTGWANNDERMKMEFEKQKKYPDYRPWCQIEYCTHCRKTIRGDQPRRICEDCTTMTLQERINTFPHVKRMADHIGMIFSSM